MKFECSSIQHISLSSFIPRIFHSWWWWNCLKCWNFFLAHCFKSVFLIDMLKEYVLTWMNTVLKWYLKEKIPLFYFPESLLKSLSSISLFLHFQHLYLKFEWLWIFWWFDCISVYNSCNNWPVIWISNVGPSIMLLPVLLIWVLFVPGWFTTVRTNETHSFSDESALLLAH